MYQEVMRYCFKHW